MSKKNFIVKCAAEPQKKRQYFMKRQQNIYVRVVWKNKKGKQNE